MIEHQDRHYACHPHFEKQAPGVGGDRQSRLIPEVPKW